MTLNENEVDAVKQMAQFIIKLQTSGQYVPGHAPRSGVFADCSMACEPQCLSVQAQHLLHKINEK